jgi:hypothetical protein
MKDRGDVLQTDGDLEKVMKIKKPLAMWQFCSFFRLLFPDCHNSDRKP